MRTTEALCAILSAAGMVGGVAAIAVSAPDTAWPWACAAFALAGLCGLVAWAECLDARLDAELRAEMLREDLEERQEVKP